MSSRVTLVLAVLLGGSFTAQAQFSKPSVEQQIRIGQKVADEIRKELKTLPVDDPHTIVLRRVATRVLSSIHTSEPWAYSFDVIKSTSVNAFSLPGGPTFFYTGLMDKLRSEDELAGVLAHELTHVRMQHWATQYASSQKRNLLINLSLLITKANYLVGELAGLTDEVVFRLPFSRYQESQADDGGYVLLVQAGYNPTGLISVFEMFRKTMRGSGDINILSDHPADEERIQHLRSRLASDTRSWPEPIPVTY